MSFSPSLVLSSGHRARVGEGNVYWDAGNRDLLEESISTLKSEVDLLSNQNNDK